MYQYFIGIDPGLEGAWALIGPSGKLENHYKFETYNETGSKRVLDMLGLLESLKAVKNSCPSVIATLEEIHASAGQGASSIVSMGFSLGVLKMACAAASMPYQVVSPMKWKNRMLSGMPKEKDASVQKVLQLFPETREILIGPRGGRDHNIADAILIAYWAKSDWPTTQRQSAS